MSQLLLTLGAAFIIVMIALGCLAIGWLLKGKSILRPGACGRDPTKKQDDKSCGTDSTCGVCKKDDDKPL